MVLVKMLLITAVVFSTFTFAVTSNCEGNSSCSESEGCPYYQTECTYGCCPYSDAVCCSDGYECCQHGQTCIPYFGLCIGAQVTANKEVTLFSNKTTPVKVRSPNANVCPTRCYGECCPLPDAVCCPDRQNCCPANHECTKDGCVERSAITPFLQQKVSKSGNLSPFAMKKCPADISCPLTTNCCLDDGKWNCCPKPRTDVTYEMCCQNVWGYECCSGLFPICTVYGCI